MITFGQKCGISDFFYCSYLQYAGDADEDLTVEDLMSIAKEVIIDI